LSDQVLEYLIHHHLECGWTIGEAEVHDEGFKLAPVSAECSLPLIAFTDADIIVPPTDV
jgi:hypothetical protein